MKSSAILLTLLTFGFCFSSWSQCVNCYSLEAALNDPECVIRLDLSNSGLTDIPAQLTSCSNLEELDLSDNLLQASVFDFDQLPHLRKLNLSNNPGLSLNLFPASFYRAPLESLDLSRCDIAALPGDLGKLPELRQLNLSNNLLTLLPDSLSLLPHLEKLDLKGNKLLSTACMFCNYWSLKVLDLRYNSLNPNLIFASMVFKDSLNELLLSTDRPEISVHDLAGLPVRKLTIASSTLTRFRGNPTRVRALEHLRLEACLLPKVEKLKRQVSLFPKLKSFEIVHDEVTENALLPRKKTPVVVQAQRRYDPRMLTSSTVSLPVVNESNLSTNYATLPNSYNMALDMIANTVSPIAENESKSYTLPTDTPCEIIQDRLRLEIPAGAFLDESGNLAKGPVKLEIKTWFDPFTMALTGAPMVKRNAENAELFSSNGMFEIKASDADGTALSPNPEQAIQVTIADVLPDTPSQLWAFDSTQNNWNAIGKPESVNTRSLFIKGEAMPFTNNFNPDNLWPIKDPYVLYYIEQKRNKPAVLKIKTFRGESMRKRFNNPDCFERGGYESALLGKNNWYIDTLVDPDLKELFSLNQRRIYYKYLKQKHPYYINTSAYPNLVQNVRLELDKANDVCRIEFIYKNEKKSIPVHFSASDRIEKTQRRYASLFKQYSRAHKRSLREEKQARYKQDQIISAFNNRQMASLPVNTDSSGVTSRGVNWNNLNKLQFSLSSFGLINCDFFRRNPPSRVLASDKKGVDQNGEEVLVPEAIRHVMPAFNTYLCTNRETIPVMGENEDVISFFILSDKELALVKNWRSEGKKVIPEVFRFNIEDKSAEEIRNEILGL